MKPSQRAATGIDRRAFLVGSGATGVLGALGSTTLLVGCAPPDDASLAARVRAALREIGFDLRGAKLLAAAGEMSPEVALRTLRRETTDRRLYTTAASSLLMREFVEAQCDEDLRRGRTRRVRGWWLAETEVAVAVLVAG